MGTSSGAVNQTNWTNQTKYANETGERSARHAREAGSDRAMLDFLVVAGLDGRFRLPGTVSAIEEGRLTMASAHVVPSGTSWQVKGNGALIHSSSTQALAISYARSWLKNNGGGELYIHGQDGAVREKDTVYPGNDPRNTPG